MILQGVPAETTERVRLSVAEARALSERAMRGIGYEAEEARILADHVIDAALCGYEYSGLPKLLNVADDPRFKAPRRPMRVLRETSVSVLLDGGNQSGMLGMYYATRAVIERASAHGFALVGVDNIWMSGRSAYYVEMAARAGLIGIHTVAAPPMVAPAGGAKAALGTNPIAFGFPMEGDPLVIDLGTSAFMGTDLQFRHRLGIPLPEGVAIDERGRPTTDAEETRYHAPWVRKQSAYWVQYNSGKKSVSMDLRNEEGKTVLRKLIKVSDVLVQNFRPGTIEEMGFGYDVLKTLNPRIIMANVSAYGQFGPYRDQIGYDPIGQTMSGIAMVTGEDGMPPIRAGVPIIDRTTALHSAIGILAALYERNISGEGQTIDVCLADSGYSLTEIPITAYHGAGIEPQRGKSDSAPSGMYPCKDGWVLIAAGDQHHWPRVCDALGKPEWRTDPRFITRRERSKHAEADRKSTRLNSSHR